LDKITGQDVLDGKAKIIDSSGLDVTELYLKGAYRTLEVAQQILFRPQFLRVNGEW
jgi:uncharacterized protein YbbK (DUF523 family)